MSQQPFEQTNRVASVRIAGKGANDLLLNAMNGVDKIGEPFKYTVEMLKNYKADIDLEDLVGKKLAITLKVTSQKKRFFHGYIADIRYGGMSAYGLESYYALVVPWIYFLKKSSRCRIFRNKSVKDILTTVFKSEDPVFEDFEIGDLPNEPKLEHCVQYQETDFAFVHRLMQEHGISYYFKHYQNKHMMVLLDDSGNRPKPSEETGKDAASELYFLGANATQDLDTISKWERHRRLVTDAFSQTDLNFADEDKFPSVLSSESKGSKKQGDFKAGSFEHYSYEAAFDEGISAPEDLETSKLTETANKVAKVRLGAYEAEKDVIYAQSDCRRVLVGYEFKLTGYDADKSQDDKEYYVTSVNHQVKIGGYGNRQVQIEKRYTCSFTAIPKETEYYPLQTIPKARIYGPQTATVINDEKQKKGQLIYTDKHGRIKVRFHWDRASDREKIDKVSEVGKDDVEKDMKNLSCWVRVAQGWAGNKWGSFFLPRVGQEVIVEFLDGDPDRPIVTGSVYNGKNLTPYKLPDHRTISTIKSENIKGDGKKAEEQNFNEIRFEDKEEAEQIFIHAAKAMDTQVIGDHRTYVGNNMQITIDGDDEQDRIKDKSDDDSIGNRDVIIKKGNDQLTLGEGNLIQIIGGSQLLDVKKQLSVTIAASANLSVGDKIVISSGSDIHIKGTNLVFEADESVSFKAKDIIFDASNSVNTTAKEIVSKGSSGVEMDGGGGSIVAAGNVGISGSSNVVIKGSKVDINGATPASPGTPKASLSIEEPAIQTAKDLKQAKVTEALREDKMIENKKPDGEIKFGGAE